MHRVKVRVVEDALDANNTIARANRREFDHHGVTVVNLMSAPGSGKTTLLERTLSHWDEGPRIGVLEGDVAGSLDADRLAHHHIPVVQLNTDNGFGGECHLDANMVSSAMDALPLDDIEILIVENVGNLVCPAEFRIGEDARIMVASVAEGDDKPLKYPLMFRACELIVINKIDLLEHVDFDMDRFLYHLDAVNPGVRVAAGERSHRRGDRGASVVAGRAAEPNPDRLAREAAAPRAQQPPRTVGARRPGPRVRAHRPCLWAHGPVLLAQQRLEVPAMLPHACRIGPNSPRPCHVSQ